MALTPIDSEHIYSEVTRFLKSSFSFEQFVSFVEHAREQRILFIEEVLPPTQTGYVMGFRDCMVVGTRQGLSFNRRLTVRTHELTHILSGHVPDYKNDPAAPTYEQARHQRRDSTHAIARSDNVWIDANEVLTDAYVEQQVEQLSARFVECMVANNNDVMRHITDLFYPFSGEEE